MNAEFFIRNAAGKVVVYEAREVPGSNLDIAVPLQAAGGWATPMPPEEMREMLIAAAARADAEIMAMTTSTVIPSSVSEDFDYGEDDLVDEYEVWDLYGGSTIKWYERTPIWWSPDRPWKPSYGELFKRSDRVWLEKMWKFTKDDGDFSLHLIKMPKQKAKKK